MKWGVTICTLACVLNVAGDWPNPLGPAYTGVQKGSGFPVYWSRNDGVVWQVKISQGTATSAPLTVGSQILLTTVSTAGNESSLSSFDGKTGRLQWRNSWSGTAKTSVVADQQWVVVAEENGQLHCFSLAGELLWEKKQSGRLSSILAEEGNIYFLSQAGTSVQLKALSGKQGKELWARELGATGSDGLGPVAPVTSLGLVLVGMADGVVAVDAKNGKELWRTSVSQLLGKGGQVAFTGNGNVLVQHAASNQIACYEVTSGGMQLRWKAQSTAGVDAPHFLSHPVGLILLNAQRNELELLERQSGTKRLELRLPDGRWTALLATSNHAYCYSEEREVAVIDLGEGKVLSRTHMTDGRERAGVHGLAFLLDRLVVCDGLNLYCVTGTKVGSRAEESAPTGNPAPERVGAPPTPGRRLPL